MLWLCGRSWWLAAKMLTGLRAATRMNYSEGNNPAAEHKGPVHSCTWRSLVPTPRLSRCLCILAFRQRKGKAANLDEAFGSVLHRVRHTAPFLLVSALLMISSRYFGKLLWCDILTIDSKVVHKQQCWIWGVVFLIISAAGFHESVWCETKAPRRQICSLYHK